MPHVVRYNAQTVGALYGELLEETSLADGQPGGPAETIARRIAGLMKAAGLPTTLSTCGVSPTILPILAEEANQQWTARFNPRPVAEPDLVKLYEAAM